jgi:hypothetical protein
MQVAAIRMVARNWKKRRVFEADQPSEVLKLRMAIMRFLQHNQTKPVCWVSRHVLFQVLVHPAQDVVQTGDTLIGAAYAR